ncbi:MAG TPA: hypothetical protein VJQ55_08885, partial [Candidatus Binatia bacterium]|nr:hypothetical protein [Candidatus Binatia bacterium]
MPAPDPTIKIQPAERPPSWDRRALFFSNIHSIFYGNVDETRQLMDEITGSHSYGGRVMSIFDLLFRERPNFVLLEVAPAPSLIEYLHGELGLSIPRYDTIDRSGYERLATAANLEAAAKTPLFRKLREHPAEWVDGFVTDAKLVRIAELLGKQTVSSLAGSKNGNNKYLLYCHQLEQQLPVFDTLLAADRKQTRDRFDELAARGYRKAVVKAQIGASGYGMVVVALAQPEIAAVPEFLFFEGPCMVQGWIEDGVLGVRKLASPSVQLFVDHDSVCLYDMTEQILSDQSVHEGNMSPPPVTQQFPELERELWRQAGIAGSWLHRQGYRGTGSVDFLIVERKGRLETIICEINARVTGATYPAFLARHFNSKGNWLMRNIAFRQPLAGTDLMGIIDRAGVLYRAGGGAGII